MAGHYTVEEKAEVVKRVLVDRKKYNEVAEEFDVAISSITRWLNDDDVVECLKKENIIVSGYKKNESLGKNSIDAIENINYETKKIECEMLKKENEYLKNEIDYQRQLVSNLMEILKQKK